MADNEKEELRPTTAADTEAAAAGSEGQSQEQEIGKPPKEPGIIRASFRLILLGRIFVVLTRYPPPSQRNHGNGSFS